METREARIKIVLDASAASRAVPGAPSAVPGLPDTPSTSPVAPAQSASGADAFSFNLNASSAASAPPGVRPSFAPASGPGVVPAAAPGQPNQTPPAYQPGRKVDDAPTITSEAGESASRPSQLRGAALGTWKGVKQVGSAALGGGSISAAGISVISKIPVAGQIVGFVAESAALADKYGPIVAGAMRGMGKESGDSVIGDFLTAVGTGSEVMIDKIARARNKLDAFGAAIEPTLELAATQAILNRGRESSGYYSAQREALGTVFEAERRIAEREMNMARAKRRIGLVAVGEQFGAQAADAVGNYLSAVEAMNAALNASLTVGSRR